MNRKAMGFGTLATIIILLVVMIVMLIIVIRTKLLAERIVEDSKCQKDIISHTLVLKLSREAISSEIYCPTQYYTLPGSNEADTKHGLAEAMKTCWGTWGKGQLDLFKDEGYYCQICSVIDFKDKTKKVTGFNQYLAETPIKSGDSLAYIDYLAGYASEKADPTVIKNMQEASSQTIDTSKTYATIFVYAKGKSFIKRVFDYAGGATGTVGGGLASGLVVGVMVGATIASGGTVAIVAGVITAAGGILGFAYADDVNWASVVLLSEYNKEKLEQIGCQISPAKQVKDQAGTS